MDLASVAPSELPPEQAKRPSAMGRAWENTKILARKNVQLKWGQYTSCTCGCFPCAIVWELLFPVAIIVLFAYLKTLTPDPAVSPAGWPVGQGEDPADSARNLPHVQRPMTHPDLTGSTAATNLFQSLLAPLHLRPKYKLALAAREAADVPRVEEFREWVTENWYPRQVLPVIPCLPSQSPGHGRHECEYTCQAPDGQTSDAMCTSPDGGGGTDCCASDGGDEPKTCEEGWTVVPAGTGGDAAVNAAVIDLADRYTWEGVDESVEDWIRACNGTAAVGDSWSCAASDRAACIALSGCAWEGGGALAAGGSCVESTSFPPSELCCSRTADGVPESATGWMSSFSDVSVLHGDGTAAELDAYIESDDYLTDESPYIAAAIVFESVPGTSDSPQAWEYSIRVNTTWLEPPDTLSPEGDPVEFFQFDLTNWATNLYTGNGWSTREPYHVVNDGPGHDWGGAGLSFTALQLTVDRYIVRTAAEGVTTAQALKDLGLFHYCPTLDCDQLAAPLKMAPYKALLTLLPKAESTKDEFYDEIAGYLPVLFIVIYLYAVYNAAQTFILEKESKAREGLRMQGVGNCTLIASWYVSLGSVYFILALLMAIASKAALFASSSFLLLLLGFWLSLIAFMAFSFAVHTLFNKAKTGGLFNIIVFTGAFMIWSNITESGVSKLVLFLGLLHPGTCCCCLISHFALFEGAGIGVTFSSMFTQKNNVTFAGSLTMLIFDTILWTVTGYYLELTLPKEWGTRLPPLFMCSKEYWFPADAEHDAAPIVPQLPVDGSYEDIGVADAQLQADGKCIAIAGLHKEFDTPDGKITAVDSVNMTMVEGQIFALLGHNGAGKTTTINMLNGIYAPTSGDAQVYGRSVSTQMANIRGMIGNCFQHDVLYLELTVKQHVAMYARLKGIPHTEVDTKVNEILGTVGLLDKLHAKAAALSGGMKRKLSLSIALVGGVDVSKALYLDEPTSGMDPFSRRSTWNMLQNARQGRTIVLTTHFMEEADMLGDRIGIMGHGSLLCCGSSLFLKNLHGAGYTLVIETAAECDAAGIKDLVKRHVSDATIQSDVGKEKSFTLPTGSSASFAALFNELDSCKGRIGVESFGLSVTTMESVFLKITAEAAGDDQADGAEDASALRKNEAAAGGFNALESTTASREKVGGGRKCCRDMLALYLKRLHFGRRDKGSIICSTAIPIAILILSLQFLTNSIVEETQTPRRLNYETGLGLPNPVIPVHVDPDNAPASSVAAALRAIPGAEVRPELSSPRGGEVFGINYTAGCPATGRPPGPENDEEAEIWSYWEGTWEAGCGGTWFGDNQRFDELHRQWVCAQNASLTSASCEACDWECQGCLTCGAWVDACDLDVDASPACAALAGDAELLAAPTLALAQDILAESMLSDDVDDVTYGAMIGVDGTPAVSFLINSTALHAAPVLLNALSNGFTSAADTTIDVNNAPLPVTGQIRKFLSQFQNLIGVIFIVIAFSFVPGSFIVFVVKEREAAHNSKHQQLISGVSVTGYWLASFLWDATLYCVPLTATMIVIVQYDLSAFSGAHCYDWNSTVSYPNPMLGDFFSQQGEGNCTDVVAVWGADQGLLEHWGTCAAANSSDAAAASACSSVEIIGESYEWNQGACSLAGYAPTEWTACMADAACKAEVAAGMAPGQGLGGVVPEFPPTPTSPLLEAAILAATVAVLSGAEDKCTYDHVWNSKPYCEMSNAHEKTKDEYALMPCDVTISTLCPVTTDSCPVTRTGATFLLFLGYGGAIICWTYLLSHFFSSHTVAQIFSVILTFVTGLVLMIVSMVLDIAFPDNPSVANTNRTLKWFYRILSPGFCLGNGLLDMAFAAIGLSLGGDEGNRILVGTPNPVGWDQSGRDIFFLFASIPLFLGLTILYDLLKTYPRFVQGCFPDKVVEDPPFEPDEDVRREEERVRSGAADGDVIRLSGLRKVYRSGGGCCSGQAPKPKAAVRGITFGIPAGECFGFLGINGAGKTSTMNMLTGNFLPSEGDAWLAGLDIKTKQLEVRSKLGYCPQHDALLDLLTVKEHLELFARVKGVPEKDLARFVSSVIEEMDLVKFKNKLASKLSGGNKRKLSVGIATIGRPPLVFLDEPSTGMDPMARRFMWDVIRRISTQDSKCSIILTTHSMEECEALCGRVGIMVDGRLRCLGSVQHLKSRFGKGYQFEVKLVAESAESVEALVASSGLEARISAQTVGAACATLGDASLAAHIAPNDPVGQPIFSALLASHGPGSIPASDLVRWVQGEKRVKALAAWIGGLFSDASLIERHDRNLRYTMGASGAVDVALGSVFDKVEAAKAELGIDDYSISQTSLEQIFNGFASQQEVDNQGPAASAAAAAPTTPLPAVAGEAAQNQIANVTVPEGLAAGDKFQCEVGGVLVELAVPEGCGPGTLLSIPVPEQPAPQPQAVAQATLVEP